uniref:Uncharacterized protein n=1 Tax=uncultured marine virus TaxID=186617 RepID=A0A0F7L545_9VIRU|nr:conserved protein of unknown function [uncultured marine virus]
MPDIEAKSFTSRSKSLREMSHTIRCIDICSLKPAGVEFLGVCGICPFEEVPMHEVFFLGRLNDLLLSCHFMFSSWT